MKSKNYRQYLVFFNPKLVVMLLTIWGLTTISVQSFAQGYDAFGSCTDSVVVGSNGVYTYPVNLFYHACMYEQNPCYWINGCSSPMEIHYRLQKWNPTGEVWEWASSNQVSKKFTGLGSSLTKYRVKVFKPAIVVNNQCDGGYENVYDIGTSHIGYRGFFEEYYTNEVLVGQPNGSNNEFDFMDGNSVLLYGSNPTIPVFDADENWTIDVSESSYYNAWYLALYKIVEGVNLPWGDYGDGWHTDGPPSNPVIGLGVWWRDVEMNDFDEDAEYMVQWVANNRDCYSWNVNEQEFYICPETLACKIGIIMGEEEGQIELYPNPVTDQFYLDGNLNVKQVELIDVFGRKHGSWTANQEHYDVSHLVSGTYYVQFYDQNHRLLDVTSIQVMR